MCLEKKPVICTYGANHSFFYSFMPSKYGNLRGRFPKGSRPSNPLFGSGSGLSGSPLMSAMRRRVSEVRGERKLNARRRQQIRSLDQALRSCHASKGVVLREGGTNTLSRTQMPRGSAKLPAYVLNTQPYSYVVNSGFQGSTTAGVQALFGLNVLTHADMVACFSGLNANYQTASKIFVESMEASVIFSNQSVALYAISSFVIIFPSASTISSIVYG